MHDSDVVLFDVGSAATVWHREPNGHDSGEVCRNWKRTKWHVHHWRFTWPMVTRARRSLLTRCEWCGGRSRKADPVNNSLSWDRPHGHWWQVETGLFHGDCTAAHRAHNTCTCPDPLLTHGDYGKCLLCGRFRAWGISTDALRAAEAAREATPAGTRPDPRGVSGRGEETA